MKIRPRLLLEAHQWHQNGDHPNDRVGQQEPDPIDGGTYTRLEGAVVRWFRHPNFPSDEVHGVCGRPWRVHGWIDQDGLPAASANVCPGDYVINCPEDPKRGYWRWPYATFQQTYEQVDPDADALEKLAAPTLCSYPECGQPVDYLPHRDGGPGSGWRHIDDAVDAAAKHVGYPMARGIGG